MQNLLVIANQTAVSAALLNRIYEFSEIGPTTVYLVVPRSTAPEEASPRAAERVGLERSRHNLAAGLEAISKLGVEASGHVGPPDPMQAAQEVIDVQTVNTILVSTLPLGVSRWLAMDLPHRLTRKYRPRPVEHIEGAAPSTAESEPPSERRAVNVLLVEDNADDVELARVALDRSAYEVALSVAPDGAQAVQKLQTMRPLPDLVLLDLKMPVLDGHGFLKKLQADLGLDALNDLYVTVVSSSNAEKDRLEAHALGAQAYIVKTPDLDQFSDAISSLVNEVATR